ncbi:hypothetical protein KDH_80010 [Dictyobacter sp. S3.2.2.5]|uniref:Uncharacterized protein n=1 Tax=Dictyobacter halimunensis TaxID=3026934 RepID=A0ABQ6G7D1_9CHLR|nr:hypothetical protein KDH_80010 [Dictyobacter sp. S3.2.2.5]
MMFDDLTTTQIELIVHVKAACQAIKFLRNVEPLECLQGKEHYEEWVRHMSALNTTRTRLGMAAEYLHSDLNSFNDAVIYADRTGEERTIIIDYGDDDYDPDQLE